MFHRTVLIFILSCVAPNFVHGIFISGALKRQTLIFHEPPYENILERADQVTEHHITQRLDNFDHQNNQTFDMVLTANLSFLNSCLLCLI